MNSENEVRLGYKRYISLMRAQGWSDEDVAEYAASIRILMGNDDAAALALYPGGAFPSAQSARDAAKTYWMTVR